MNEQQPVDPTWSAELRSEWITETNEMADQAADPDRLDESQSGEELARDGPRIFVASLSDYNNGVLHGRWLDAVDDEEVMQDQVNQMLAASPTAKRYGEAAEEWAIHDYEGFGELRVAEYDGLALIARLAAGIDRHGLAFAAWVSHVGERREDLIDQFEDRYQGEWDSIEAYADHLLDELDAQRIIDEAPEWLHAYIKIDPEGLGRDLEVSGDVVTAQRPEGGIWVFTGN